MPTKAQIMVVIGTRPEAIKMAPVIAALRKENTFRVKVVSTGQQREMLDQVLKLFKIKTDYDLHIMQAEQSLTQISFRILDRFTDILLHEKPAMILVHGDTPTAFMASLAAFYQRIPISHVEAGLRTYNKYEPFPEEMNRQMIDILADYFFAPTDAARDNLLKEGKPADHIFVTGNTVIDAVLAVSGQDQPFKNSTLRRFNFEGLRSVLLTTHRRENLGEGLVSIYEALLQLLDRFQDIQIVFPVHLNPAVRRPANEYLGQHPRVLLIDPLDYADMAKMMKLSYIVMTDSGGLQEEAPALGKPVLVLRNTTERPEGVAAGTLRLVGTDTKMIVQQASELLSDDATYQRMAQISNPYGDGTASAQIMAVLKRLI